VSVSILFVDDVHDIAELFRLHCRRETDEGTYVLHFAYPTCKDHQMTAYGTKPKSRRGV